MTKQQPPHIPAKSQLIEAGAVASSLLEDLEVGTVPSDRVLMKAARIARLLRDSDAQTWLSFELRGYPANFDIGQIGNCRQYLRESGRSTPDGKFLIASLPHIEAIAYSDKLALERSESPATPPPVFKNYLEVNATQTVIASQRRAVAALTQAYQKHTALLAALRSAVHSYASDCLIANQLGETAQGIFEGARLSVEAFVRAYCPRAAEKLIAVNERMQDGNAEGRAAALTSCRRLLMDVADATFPAQDQEWIDSLGKGRGVKSDQYKNRILAFLDKSLNVTGGAIFAGELEHLAARLDAVYNKTCKGTHAEVGLGEARQAIISTYLIVGEVANVHQEVIR